jgi:quercetin dioxygenase-like cupin family protein
MTGMPRTRSEHETEAGDRVAFLRTASETGGELLEMRVRYAPTSKAPPLHLHPVQEERFEVTSGALWTRVGGREATFEAGERFVVPAGTPHAMRPADERGAEVVWQVRPALDSEAFFRALWGLEADGTGGRPGRRGLLRSVAIARRFSREFRLWGPPPAVQRVLLAVLAPVATLLGYDRDLPPRDTPH